MCHEEHDLAKQQRTAIITVDENDKITSYEEKPKEPKGHLAVPPFYFYKSNSISITITISICICISFIYLFF